MSTTTEAQAIESRKATCTECGCEGYHVDTDCGEIIEHGSCVATVYAETCLMSSGGDLLCEDCALEREAPRTMTPLAFAIAMGDSLSDWGLSEIAQEVSVWRDGRAVALMADGSAIDITGSHREDDIAGAWRGDIEPVG